MATTTTLDDTRLDYSHTSGYIHGQPPVQGSERRLDYQNVAHIEAWAAGTAGDLEHARRASDVQGDAFLSSESMWTDISPQVPSYVTHSNSSEGSDIWNAVTSQQANGSVFTDAPHGSVHSHKAHIGDDSRIHSTLGLGLEPAVKSNKDHYAMDFDHTIGQPPYPSPTEDDMSFSLSLTDQHCITRDGNDTTMTCHEWSSPTTFQEMRTGFQEDNNFTNGWTSASVDYSDSSHSSHPTGTPVSLSQDLWDEAVLGTQPSVLSGPQSMMSALLPFSEVQSTVRPSQGSRRSPLPDLWMQPLQDVGSQAYGSPISMFPSSRRSSEGEPLSARRDPLYQLQSREDGHWKCIFIDIDNGKTCDHEPFKLKCNYDKHLDSHLKPYRCKQSGCAENPFSSTACLLRHEREAHGMHNHKEVLCRIRECERSFPGKGFPRKWNANDHMKRVHRYTPPEDSNSGDGSSPSGSSVEMSYPASSCTRRSGKKATSPSENSRSKRTKATSGRTTKGSVRNSSSRQLGSEHSDSAEQIRPPRGFHSQMLHTGMDWTQWSQYQDLQISGPGYFQTDNHL